MLAISHDLRTALKRIAEKLDGILCAVGVLVYAGAGALCLLLGLNFLDYKALAPVLFVDQIMARSHGILIVEIGRHCCFCHHDLDLQQCRFGRKI